MSILINCTAFNNGINRVAIRKRLFQRLQNDRNRALALARTIGTVIKRLRSAGGRFDADFYIAFGQSPINTYASCYGLIAVTGLNRLARQMDSH
ncbi:hypothetical protein D3C85_1600070 [compost metagenome]